MTSYREVRREKEDLKDYCDIIRKRWVKVNSNEHDHRENKKLGKMWSTQLKWFSFDNDNKRIWHTKNKKKK